MFKLTKNINSLLHYTKGTLEIFLPHGGNLQLLISLKIQVLFKIPISLGHFFNFPSRYCTLSISNLFRFSRRSCSIQTNSHIIHFTLKTHDLHLIRNLFFTTPNGEIMYFKTFSVFAHHYLQFLF